MYLSFERLTKHYGAVTALQDVTFGVERSEFVSLLGPSGCGKTTTLMLLAGFEQPTSGRILLEGK
ncbi:MAG: ATP-binding cassette domain-containing protein, partial [Limnochordia bacterium]